MRSNWTLRAPASPGSKVLIEKESVVEFVEKFVYDYVIVIVNPSFPPVRP